MHPILLDTATGKTCEAKSMDSSLFWWSEGNGSCDCNRATAMDVDNGTECRSERFLAIDVIGDLEGLTKKEVLAAMNDDYPPELILKHLKV